MEIKKFISITEDIRNIYNQEEIDSFVNTTIRIKNLDSLKDKHIISWLKNNFKNYLIRQHTVEKITDYSNLKKENWVLLGINNKNLCNVVLDTDLKSKIEHIVDYFVSQNNSKNLSKVSFRNALKKSIDWTASQEKVVDDIPGRDDVFVFEDGYKFVKLNSRQAVQFESTEMNHCLSLSYINQVLAKEKDVYSLRDEKNNPHVTLMIDKRTNIIEEIKGNSNTVIKDKYQKYLVDIFNKFYFSDINPEEIEYIPNIDFSDKFEFVEGKNNNKFSSNLALSIKHLKDNEEQEFFRPITIKYTNANHHYLDHFKTYKFNELVVSSFDNNLNFKNLNIPNLNTNVGSVINVDNDHIEKLNITNLNIINLSINNIGSVINIDNDHIENLKISSLSKNVQFSLKSKKIKFLNLDFLSTKTVSCLDLSNSDLENLSIKGMSIQKLILPNNVKKIHIRQCYILESNLKDINCDILVTDLDSFSIKSELKAKTVCIKKSDSKIKNKNYNIVSDNFFTDVPVLNIEHYQFKNIISPNLIELNNESLLNLNEYYFDKRELHSSLCYYYDEQSKSDDYQMNSFDFSTIVKDKNLAKFDSYFKKNYFSINKFMNCNLITRTLPDSILVTMSSSFNKADSKEINEIVFFNFINFLKGETVTLDYFQNLLINPISETCKNFILLKHENSDYGTINSIIETEETQEEFIYSKKLRNAMLDDLDVKYIDELKIKKHVKNKTELLIQEVCNSTLPIFEKLTNLVSIYEKDQKNYFISLSQIEILVDNLVDLINSKNYNDIMAGITDEYNKVIAIPLFPEILDALYFKKNFIDKISGYKELKLKPK